MKNWLPKHRLPILTACFILGLLAADRFTVSLFLLASLAGSFFLLSLWRRQFRMALLLFLMLGWIHGQLQFTQHRDVHDQSFPDSLGSYQLTIAGPLRFTTAGFTALAQLTWQERIIPVQLRVYQGVSPLFSGDVVRVWGRIRPVSGFRNPHAPDPVRQAEREGILWTVQVRRAELIVPVGRISGWTPTRFVERWRYRLRERWLQASDAPASGLARGIILGDRSGLTEELKDDFRRSGLAHLLAISGQHVGLIALLFFLLFRGVLFLWPTIALTIPLSSLAWLLAWLPSSCYVAVAGFPISAVRAWVILTCLVVATVCRQTQHLFSALAAAALGILLFQPSALFEASFQLSFIATAALILCLQPKTGRRLFQPRQLLFASIIATFATVPLVAHYFTQVAVGGIAANLIAIPYFGLLCLPLSFLATCGLVLSPAIASPLVAASNLALQGLWGIAHQVATWLGTISVGLRPLPVVLIYGAVIAGLCLPGSRWRRLTVSLVLLISLLGGESLATYFLQKGILSVTLLDVGQGDALVIRFPDRSVFLVDGGGFYIPKEQRDFKVTDPGERVLVPYLRREGVSKLAGVLLTHPHPDHYGGLLAIARQFPIQNFYWNGDESPGSDFQELLILLKQKGTIFQRVDQRTASFEREGVQLEWLNPMEGKSVSLNDRSLVVRLTYGKHCFLLTGDIEAVAEGRLVQTKELPCTVLKVPHHLSRTSSSPEFLQNVRPDYAIASLGRNNPFGFPHPEVVQRYQEEGVPLYRTDQQGAITIKTDGRTMKVKTVRSSSLGFPRR